MNSCSKSVSYLDPYNAYEDVDSCLYFLRPLVKGILWTQIYTTSDDIFLVESTSSMKCDFWGPLESETETISVTDDHITARRHWEVRDPESRHDGEDRTSSRSRHMIWKFLDTRYVRLPQRCIVLDRVRLIDRLQLWRTSTSPRSSQSSDDSSRSGKERDESLYVVCVTTVQRSTR